MAVFSFLQQLPRSASMLLLQVETEGHQKEGLQKKGQTKFFN